MPLFLKILILVVVIYLFEKVSEKFAHRDTMVSEIAQIQKNYNAVQTKMQETMDNYQKSYAKLASDYKDYQKRSEELFSQNDQMTTQIVQCVHQMMEDQDRLFRRLETVNGFLSSPIPTNDQKDELIRSIQEDLKLKDDFERQRQEFLQSLAQHHGFDVEEPEMSEDP